MYPGSEQYAGISRDLARVNCTAMPHVVFAEPDERNTLLPRSVYRGERQWGDGEGALEPLFEKHGVNLALWGQLGYCEAR